MAIFTCPLTCPPSVKNKGMARPCAELVSLKESIMSDQRLQEALCRVLKCECKK